VQEFLDGAESGVKVSGCAIVDQTRPPADWLLYPFSNRGSMTGGEQQMGHDLSGLGPLRPDRVDQDLWCDLPVPLKVTVSGSFRKYGDTLSQTIAAMRKSGHYVLSPKSGEIDSVDRGFAYLHGDPSRNKRLTEDRHLDAIRSSDFMWIINKDGHLGISTAFEMGFATALGVPIYANSEFKDDPISTYSTYQYRWKHAAVIEARKPRRGLPSALLLNPESSVQRLEYEVAAMTQLLNSAGPILSNEEAQKLQAMGRRCGRILGSLAVT
jgi:nucleoside 2-deoxyribosyltransferase